MWNLGGMSLTLHEDKVVTIHTKDPEPEQTLDPNFKTDPGGNQGSLSTDYRAPGQTAHACEFSTLSTREAKADQHQPRLQNKTLSQKSTHTQHQSCGWCPRSVVQYLGGLKPAWTAV